MYNKFTIPHARHLKEEQEKLLINRNENRIASLDIENMYSSVKKSTIKKAVNYFTSSLLPKACQTT